MWRRLRVMGSVARPWETLRTYCCESPQLPSKIQEWLEQVCELCTPRNMHIWEGSVEEREHVIADLVKSNTLVQLKKHNNCFLARSDPGDTYRDESRVYLAAYSKEDFIPRTSPNPDKSILGNYMPVPLVERNIQCRFNKSMKGKKMYVIPFSLGPPNEDLKILGIQVTDHGLTALLTSLLVRCGQDAMIDMAKAERDEGSSPSSKPGILKLLHSAGPLGPPHWPYDPEKAITIIQPEKAEVWSYGSGYWENSVLTKKRAALQFASLVGKTKGFLAANMSVMGIEDSCGKKVYVGVMGPSGTGRSVVAATRGCPGFQTTLVSDDIAWLRPDCGILHAYNPESGLMPLVRGIKKGQGGALMEASCSNSILLNVASAGEDEAWWEGLDVAPVSPPIIDWKNKPWQPDGLRAAHLDARFCSSMKNMMTLDCGAECGVPLVAIVVATRRNHGYPLLMETHTWAQGVFHALSLRTRHHNAPLDNDDVVWEPFGARNYLGYNLGKMVENWLSLGAVPDLDLPKVFLLNLFLFDNCTKDLMWPGYEFNTRLLEWVVGRSTCGDCLGGRKTPLGVIPDKEDFDLPCSVKYGLRQLFFFDKDFWHSEFEAFENLMTEQVPFDMPEDLCKLMTELKEKVDPCDESTCSVC